MTQPLNSVAPTTPLPPVTVAAPVVTPAPAAAPPSSGSASGQLLESSFAPAKGVPGGVYKVVEKDTGRVVVELPFPVDSSSPGAAGQQLDVKA